MQFDFVAKYYDTLSRIVFGDILGKAKISLFDQITDGSKLLFIGGGSGTSLQHLLSLRANKNNSYRVDFVDFSINMISLAQNRVSDNSDVQFYQLPIEEFEGAEYDIIITEFFFDLFDEHKIKELIKIIGLKLINDGKWIDTDFRKSLKLKNRVILKIMYLFFKIAAGVTSTKLICTSPLFIKAGFEIKHELAFKSGFISSIVFARPECFLNQVRDMAKKDRLFARS